MLCKKLQRAHGFTVLDLGGVISLVCGRHIIWGEQAVMSPEKSHTMISWGGVGDKDLLEATILYAAVGLILTSQTQNILIAYLL